MATDVVREKNTSLKPISFTDENSNAVTPTSATYQIDDESGTVITAETSFTPGNLTISSNDNRILDTTKSAERRTVTIKWVYSGGTKNGADQFDYLVKNLTKVS